MFVVSDEDLVARKASKAAFHIRQKVLHRPQLLLDRVEEVATKGGDDGVGRISVCEARMRERDQNRRNKGG